MSGRSRGPITLALALSVYTSLFRPSFRAGRVVQRTGVYALLIRKALIPSDDRDPSQARGHALQNLRKPITTYWSGDLSFIRFYTTKLEKRSHFLGAHVSEFPVQAMQCSTALIRLASKERKPSHQVAYRGTHTYTAPRRPTPTSPHPQDALPHSHPRPILRRPMSDHLS